MQPQRYFKQARCLWTEPQIANLSSLIITRLAVLSGFLALMERPCLSAYWLLQVRAAASGADAHGR